MVWNDPIVDEIHKIREEIMEEHDCELNESSQHMIYHKLISEVYDDKKTVYR